MPIFIPRWTIGRLMVLVAVTAGVFAIYSMMATSRKEVVRPALMIPLILLVAMTPVRFAQPRRWVVVSSWIIALWPLSIVVSLHVVFAVVSVAEGSSLGQRVFHPVTRMVLGQSVVWSGISSLIVTLIGFYLPLIAPDHSGVGPRRWNPQLVPVGLICPVWLAVIGILYWDPAGAFGWFSD